MSFKYSVEDVLDFLENCHVSFTRDSEDKVTSIFTISTQHLKVDGNFKEVLEECIDEHKEYGNTSALSRLIKKIENENSIPNVTDTHVYCTNCKYFRLCDEGLPYCLFEDECNINSCKDSRPFSERPYYKEMR